MKNTVLLIVAFGFLFLNSCMNNNNVEESKELEYILLKEINRDLKQNLDDISSNVKGLVACERANEIVLDHMENQLDYHDSLDHHFANLYPYIIFSPNQNTYEYLKQNGMFLISNDTIRAALSDLYGVQFELYKSFESIYFVEHYTNYIKPMFIAEFGTFEFYNSFKPVNYARLIKNQEYNRIMSYTLDATRSFIFLQSGLKENVEKLIADIDKEMN